MGSPIEISVWFDMCYSFFTFLPEKVVNAQTLERGPLLALVCLMVQSHATYKYCKEKLFLPTPAVIPAAFPRYFIHHGTPSAELSSPPPAPGNIIPFTLSIFFPSYLLTCKGCVPAAVYNSFKCHNYYFLIDLFDVSSVSILFLWG